MALDSIEELDMRQRHLGNWKVIELKGNLTPRYNLGVAHLRENEVTLFGGDAVRKVGHEIYIFDTVRHTIRKKADNNRIDVNPSFFPCVKSQSNNIVTIDKSSYSLMVYNSNRELVHKINTLRMLEQKGKDTSLKEEILKEETDDTVTAT